MERVALASLESQKNEITQLLQTPTSVENVWYVVTDLFDVRENKLRTGVTLVFVSEMTINCSCITPMITTVRKVTTYFVQQVESIKVATKSSDVVKTRINKTKTKTPSFKTKNKTKT